MLRWTVWKYLKASGRCPLDDWLASKQITQGDRARLDGRIETIEGLEHLPPEFLKMYKGTRLHELKVRAIQKQLRPLCWIMPERKVLILCGAFERDDKIPKGDLVTAENLLSDYLGGRGCEKRYFED
jgi:hypothetical protein